MTFADRWLLPEGVEEILPADAENVESLRRKLLDLYRCWGYDLVIPPMVEYADALLIGIGHDIDLLTFRVTDQLSGRMLGLRADITPQTARMDAHSLKREGATRLCYSGHVLHAKPKSPLATRTPLQAGVELFGEGGLDADIEVISLLIASLEAAGIGQIHIDIGHVGIFRALAEFASLSTGQEGELFDLLQRKASTEIAEWVKTHITDSAMADWFLALPNLAGDASIIEQAKTLFADAPGEVLSALDELGVVAAVVQARYPQAELYFDLSELRGYHYHTGIVFGAFVPGFGEAVANGGRYDYIGEVFGRGRPATGFSLEITALYRLMARQSVAKTAIYAAPSDDHAQWQAVQALRASGERVVCGMPSQSETTELACCNRRLVLRDGKYIVESL